MSSIRNPYGATRQSIEQTLGTVIEGEGVQWPCGCQHVKDEWQLCAYHDGFEVGFEIGEHECQDRMRQIVANLSEQSEYFQSLPKSDYRVGRDDGLGYAERLVRRIGDLDA